MTTSKSLTSVCLFKRQYHNISSSTSTALVPETVIRLSHDSHVIQVSITMLSHPSFPNLSTIVNTLKVAISVSMTFQNGMRISKISGISTTDTSLFAFGSKRQCSFQVSNHFTMEFQAQKLTSNNAVGFIVHFKV